MGQLLTAIDRSGASRGSTFNFKQFLANREIPQAIADQHAPLLISILERHRAVLESTGAWDIIEVLPRFTKSAESKHYMLRILNEPVSLYRNGIIRHLNWTNTWVEDNELFDALVRIYEREGDVNRSLLSAMQKVSNKRVDPYLRKALLDAKTKDEYGGLASIVSRTGNNELFEVMLSRMPEFGRPAWASQKQFDEYEQWRKERDAEKVRAKTSN